MVSEVRRLDDSLLPRRLWRAGRGCGEEGPVLQFLSSPLAAARVEAQLEGLLLLLALAGAAGYLKNALLRRRLGCYVVDCARPRRKERKKAWKEVALHPVTFHFPPGRLAAGPTGVAQANKQMFFDEYTQAYCLCGRFCIFS